jgi:hypothetical protein
MKMLVPNLVPGTSEVGSLLFWKALPLGQLESSKRERAASCKAASASAARMPRLRHQYSNRTRCEVIMCMIRGLSATQTRAEPSRAGTVLEGAFAVPSVRQVYRIRRHYRPLVC